MSDFPPEEVVFDVRVRIPNDEYYTEAMTQLEDALDELRNYIEYSYPSDPLNVVAE